MIAETAHMRLIATWTSTQPQEQAELVIERLKDAEQDFFEIRHDRHVPEPRRFESRDGLLYMRGYGTENPSYRAGWTELEVIVMIDFPDLPAWRQRRLSLLRWDSYKINDTEREERMRERAWKAISDAGLNPHEAKIEWEIT